LVLSGAGNVTFSNSITLNAPVPTNVFGLFVSGTVKTTLTAVNTYNGDTTVSGGTLVLGAASSIANSTNIVVGGSGTLDVSAAGLVLGANRSFLNTSNGATATGTIVGNLNASAGTLTMFYNSGVPAFNITNGTFSLSSSTVVNVTNNGAALTAASYKLISKSSTGLPGAVSAGSLPAVTVSGNGLASGASASLAITSGELYLVVSGGTLTPPVVATNSVSLTGGKMVFSFSGVSGQTWNILTSTNAALPLSSWTTNFSGTFSGSIVSFTNSSPTDSQRFYIIKSP
jgi:autotransporter-associated beta strand protein